MQIYNEGQPGRLPNVYVNYAVGGEKLEDVYGHEAWRIKKLKELKKKYDPQNKFKYYNPIVKNGV